MPQVRAACCKFQFYKYCGNQREKSCQWTNIILHFYLSVLYSGTFFHLSFPRNFISSHLISFHFISYHLILSHLITSYHIKSYLISFHLISSHLVSTYLISPIFLSLVLILFLANIAISCAYSLSHLFLIEGYILRDPGHQESENALWKCARPMI